ncbi:MAG: efflux RND transporter periplasmic adaptor subunit, partial [Bacillota bacterium]
HYFKLGPHESFLLLGLDGQQTRQGLCEAFERQFGEPLDDEELEEFLELARGSDLLQGDGEELRPQSVENAEIKQQVKQPEPAVPQTTPARARQSILYWRKKIFDPDRLFTWMAPKLWFVWTRAFLALSFTSIVAAGIVVWANHQELLSRLPSAWRWETAVLAWLTLVVATTCHEFSHGLTCKHHGGEVHEIGFLMIFFTPAFYCNVSDSWLFPEKSKRLWVMFAGGYCDLVIWAMAVFVWRLTLQDTMLNHVAWVALTVCGTRIFFNFNPLIKLDGYYLLSDGLGIPNLYQRARDGVAARVRWGLWGAARPEREARNGLLLTFGVVSWLYTLLFLSLMLYGFIHYLGTHWGPVGFAGASVFGLVVMRGLVRGMSSGEARRMLVTRRLRTAGWMAILGAGGAAMYIVQINRWADGPFQVRPAQRDELAAPIAGFLKEVYFDEGDSVPAGAVVARMEIPDLETRTRQKRDEIVELESKIRQYRGDVVSSTEECEEIAKARKETVASIKEYREALDRLRLRRGQVEQTEARLAHCQEELAYLEQLSRKSVIHSPGPGVMVTPHLRERVGEYFWEGDSICLVEELAMTAEVKLPEQEAAEVRPGQLVRMKARALPYETFRGVVERTAPAANSGEVQSSVTVYCRIDHCSQALKSGMTGHARIRHGRSGVGMAAVDRALRFIRTEFWW